VAKEVCGAIGLAIALECMGMVLACPILASEANILVMSIIMQHLNHIFRTRVPKPYFRPRGPSKQVGDVFQCILVVFRIEFAYGNG